MTKQKKIDLAKQLLAFANEYGSGILFFSIIRKNVAVTRIDKKVAVFIAAFMMSGVAAQHASKYSDGFVDYVVKAWDDIKSEIRKN